MPEYQLRYLPQFYEDMKEHTQYISNVLLNPQAAADLIDAVEKAILDRLPVAEAFECYHSRKERRYPYYRICVKNYVIFYVVIPEQDKKTWKSAGFFTEKAIGNKAFEARMNKYVLIR